ncbi:tRNA pseudouridine(38-40) synthase [Polytolypa hystricis UAMH7299]|uniref:tRNA pseudouridine synthase 1 n=1 Tax=Polytolypa hystricis (strain UAMH7299) TaxID=1447883 RepID=A0A2B7YRY7_POLH7|nr:tRNA pseudouridine(38-40) synthase [Polytolypa hystricis UAMH7299]
MDTSVQPSEPVPAKQPAANQSTVPSSETQSEQLGQRSPNDRKRKRDGESNKGRGGRKHKAKDLGRKAWGQVLSSLSKTQGSPQLTNTSRESIDKRARNEESQAKRQKTEDGELLPIYATQFSKEDIEADQRRPKKKVAVLMGYSGSGYHGMQLSNTHKTIEGDLFAALVAAGAISKANAIDPKKSSFVRCARTDKGVHAAGNIVSLKLIIEDADIVKKINDNLTHQIRVWGIEQTNKSFSAYQLCDSRVYEYLIPTHCFLPPHPCTQMGQKLDDLAEKHDDVEGYKQRQAEVATWWDDIDDKSIKPILSLLPEASRRQVQEALHIYDKPAAGKPDEDAAVQPAQSSTSASNTVEQPEESTQPKGAPADSTSEMTTSEAIAAVRAAYVKAKKAYRIDPDRLARINEALDLYVGTRNFHNYTIQKGFREASAKRLIKSFKVSRDPLIINGTEWLSLKVHGQSFMMHQIRKMVAMVTMLVRCGGDIQRIVETYGPEKIPIPKAPGLGLLLERPIFEIYNTKKAPELGREPLDFSKYEKEIDEFKQREIYERIFREEEEIDAFSNFFNHIDTWQENTFLYVTSGGIPASKSATAKEGGGKGEKKDNNAAALAEVESESEDEVPADGVEEGG